jgi:hypothetical protein
MFILKDEAAGTNRALVLMAGYIYIGGGDALEVLTINGRWRSSAMRPGCSLCLFRASSAARGRRRVREGARRDGSARHRDCGAVSYRRKEFKRPTRLSR